MKIEKMNVNVQKYLDKAKSVRNSKGDPAIASIQGSALISATLWNVCAEVCGRLEEIELAIREQRRAF